MLRPTFRDLIDMTTGLIFQIRNDLNDNEGGETMNDN